MFGSLLALSFGGVIGIGVAVGVVVVAIVILIIWLVERHDHKKQINAEVDKLNEEEGLQEAPACEKPVEEKKAEPAKEEAVEEAAEETAVEAESENVQNAEIEPEKPQESEKVAPASVKKVVLEEGQSYNRSMKARLILSGDDVKAWYSDLKNEVQSYKGARCSLSWKQEKATYKRQPICKFVMRGKVLCVCFALESDEIKNPSIKVEDISGRKVNDGTPVMLRIKNNRRVKQAKDLIGVAARKAGLEKVPRHAVDYAAELATRSEDELVAEGLIKITKATHFAKFTPSKKK